MESKSIIIGQYIPGETIIHHLDPRAKLLALIMYVVAIFLVHDIIYFTFYLFMVLLMFYIARIPPSYLYRGIKPVIYISAITLVLHIFFTSGGEVLFRYGNLTIESEGLMMGLFTVFRLLLLVYAALLLTLTTTPLTLTAGLEYFLRPLRYVGLPVTDIVMVLTIALRFIPTLLEESQRIVRAQKARGADFEERGLIRKIRLLAPVIVPLFVSAFRRADELAVAMEARCYRVGEHRTSMYELKFQGRDYWALVLSFALLLTMIWLRVF